MICVSELTVKVAATPPTSTRLAVPNAVPVITTEVPLEPWLGVKELIRGGGRTVKGLVDEALPTVLVTSIRPVLAWFGTEAEIAVSLDTV